MVQKVAGVNITEVDWQVVFKSVIEAKGIPTKISEEETKQ